MIRRWKSRTRRFLARCDTCERRSLWRRPSPHRSKRRRFECWSCWNRSARIESFVVDREVREELGIPAKDRLIP